jgi:hypothetical protein
MSSKQLTEKVWLLAFVQFQGRYRLYLLCSASWLVAILKIIYLLQLYVFSGWILLVMHRKSSYDYIDNDKA